MTAATAAPGGQNDAAAYWTKLLGDPAFRAMPVEQRTAFLQKHVAEQQAQQHTQSAAQDQSLGQTVGAVPKHAGPSAANTAGETGETSRSEGSNPSPGTEPHPLDHALTDPTADHMAELQRYVYGP
jgi:hypothetical protein